jgi:DNA-binding NtrC family response regulator
MVKVKPTILYLDDEVMLLNLFKEIFRDEYQVETASTPAEARHLLTLHAPDVIISDWSMPEISGVEFLREVAGVCPKAFRILLTGFAHAGEMIKEIRTGIIQQFIPKPWSEVEMRQALERALLAYSPRR